MSLWKKISLGVLILSYYCSVRWRFWWAPPRACICCLTPRTAGCRGWKSAVTGGWRDLRLKNIRYEQPGVAVNAGEFHLAVKLGCLRDSQLCVNDLSLKDVNVAIDSKKCRSLSLSKKRTAAR